MPTTGATGGTATQPTAQGSASLSVNGLVDPKRIPEAITLVPLDLNSVIFWQDIFNHLDVALYSCGSEDNSKSVQLSCLAPATPGRRFT